MVGEALPKLALGLVLVGHERQPEADRLVEQHEVPVEPVHVDVVAAVVRVQPVEVAARGLDEGRGEGVLLPLVHQRLEARLEALLRRAPLRRRRAALAALGAAPLARLLGALEQAGGVAEQQVARLHLRAVAAVGAVGRLGQLGEERVRRVALHHHVHRIRDWRRVQPRKRRQQVHAVGKVAHPRRVLRRVGLLDRRLEGRLVPVSARQPVMRLGVGRLQLLQVTGDTVEASGLD